MNNHKELINDFYSAFARHDHKGMAACYHDEIEFHDPAFGTLKGLRAKGMWQMLLERSAGKLKVNFTNVQANEKNGSARWEAFYPFSKTGRNVHNKIEAHFEFKDGKIYRHRDHFGMWRWSRQAFGLTGTLLGFTPFFKKKVRATAIKSLDSYMLKLT